MAHRPLSARTASAALMAILSVGSLAAAEPGVLLQSAPDSESVLTPMGKRPRAQVHGLERGQGLNIVGDHIDVLDEKGVVAARHHRGARQENPAVDPRGWITDTMWYNATGHPITSFQSTWQVPPPPTAWDGQTVFLFNGLENSDHILQPVLQYGYSAAGGGPFWSIASWYVGSDGSAYHTGLTPIAPGTPIAGIMARTGTYGSGNHYVCYFYNYGASVLPIYSIPELKYAFETLECYNLRVPNQDYPATNGTVFYNINLQTTAGYAPLQWTVQNWVSDRGQHAYVISNSPVAGAIALFYY